MRQFGMNDSKIRQPMSTRYGRINVLCWHYFWQNTSWCLEFSGHVVTSIDPCLVFVGLAGVGEVWVGGPGYLGPSEG